ncbi:MULTISPECIES: A/G-specific adenine glycosylase [Rhodomicrobium]|uniref:A/G-specific adenine glycosylase n=1 Tax=Rhodomicrobium TaxID=1068 RepID=UPI000B4B9BA8|nr:MULTISPECIES: A/G-specific adenine glycosylase [Rhodomicrobium]
MARPQAQRSDTGSGSVAADLLAWYDVSARALPWRQPPGIPADPYAVWLSEIMLQQTTVKAVIPYFAKFLARWPRVTDLAAADLNDVLAAWAGLGYYSRARNLHACAQAVAERHGGRFPSDEAQLLALPGIGAYTGAAIAAIAFDLRATAVDGNVERVVARLFAVEAPLPGAKPEIKRLAALLTPAERPGDFTQAMMDLGATICSPRSPSCLLCPIEAHCAARARGIAAALPAKAAKKERPNRFGAAFVAIRGDGAVLLRRRAPKGLLGGMLEVPSTEWRAEPPGPDAALASAPLAAEWQRATGPVGHTFTHFHLKLDVYLGRIPATPDAPEGCRWYPQAALPGEALPSVMRKVLARAVERE